MPAYSEGRSMRGFGPERRKYRHVATVQKSDGPGFSERQNDIISLAIKSKHERLLNARFYFCTHDILVLPAVAGFVLQ
jgi:hypothetical protein